MQIRPLARPKACLATLVTMTSDRLISALMNGVIISACKVLIVSFGLQILVRTMLYVSSYSFDFSPLPHSHNACTHTHTLPHLHTNNQQYYAVIEIAVQKCKDYGIDTKVHGIKVIGRVEMK